MILIFVSPVKTRKYFSPLVFFYCLNISFASFGEKKLKSVAPFYANKDNLALLRNMTNLFCRHVFFFFFFFFFSNFYFSNVNVFMFSYFDQNFIEKFLWESGFQILVK